MEDIKIEALSDTKIKVITPIPATSSEEIFDLDELMNQKESLDMQIEELQAKRDSLSDKIDLFNSSKAKEAMSVLTKEVSTDRIEAIR